MPMPKPHPGPANVQSARSMQESPVARADHLGQMGQRSKEVCCCMDIHLASHESLGHCLIYSR